ncbi:kinase, partial [Escherichia coli]|uniref:PfkB family carbohydrate kinase n=1 Tax=Escherichia coli TaxID=562 RepID=UPI0018507A29
KANKVTNWYSRIHTLKPTQNELELLWGQPIKDDNNRIRAVNSLHQQGVKRIFVYLKEESVFCSDEDGEHFVLTAPAHTT